MSFLAHCILQAGSLRVVTLQPCERLWRRSDVSSIQRSSRADCLCCPRSSSFASSVCAARAHCAVSLQQRVASGALLKGPSHWRPRHNSVSRLRRCDRQRARHRCGSAGSKRRPCTPSSGRPYGESTCPPANLMPPRYAGGDAEAGAYMLAIAHFKASPPETPALGRGCGCRLTNSASPSLGPRPQPLRLRRCLRPDSPQGRGCLRLMRTRGALAVIDPPHANLSDLPGVLTPLSAAGSCARVAGRTAGLRGAVCSQPRLCRRAGRAARAAARGAPPSRRPAGQAGTRTDPSDPDQSAGAAPAWAMARVAASAWQCTTPRTVRRGLAYARRLMGTRRVRTVAVATRRILKAMPRLRA